MKTFIIGLFLTLGITASAQEKSKVAVADKTQKIEIVEAACGQCKFDLDGNGCDLAVRINGKSYFVDGTSIDDHGDAHEKDGFCNAIRKAKVQGRVVKDRFVVSYFELVPASKETKAGEKPVRKQ